MACHHFHTEGLNFYCWLSSCGSADRFALAGHFVGDKTPSCFLVFKDNVLVLNPCSNSVFFSLIQWNRYSLGPVLST